MTKHTDNINDAQVINLGKRAAYDRLFRDYFPALCYFARRILKGKQDAEDLVMDCFAKLWEKQKLIEDSETTKTFLYTTVRNACIDRLRKKTVRVVSIETNIQEIYPDIKADFIDHLIEAEVMREIIAAAETLPSQIRKVFDLYFIEGKNEREISEELHTSYNTVRNQRQRAVALLKGKLQVIRKQSLLFSGLLFSGWLGDI